MEIILPKEKSNVLDTIKVITDLNELASKAQEKILAIPKRLEKVAEYIEQRTAKKTFSFDFIYQRILVFE